MSEFETKNALIKSARLELSDSGFLTAWLSLDYGGAAQGFGGRVLHLSKDSKRYDATMPYAGEWILRVMQIAGVSRWDQLPGKAIRARASFSEVWSIGHILNDDWFTPVEDFETIRAGINGGAK